MLGISTLGDVKSYHKKRNRVKWGRKRGPVIVKLRWLLQVAFSDINMVIGQ